MTDIGQIHPPGGQEAPPNLVGGFELIVFEGFDTLNTKPTRPAIGNKEMFVCDNWMPIGPSNLRTLYDIGSAIYSSASGNPITYFNFGNISDSPIAVAVTSDGSITQINTSTLASTLMAPPKTISAPSQQIGFAQWGSQYIIMVAPQTNGYFLWDGTLFYQAGTVGPTVTISNGGLNYSALPTITPIGGHGTGATFNSTISSGGSVNTITVATTGSGYTATDGPVYLQFSAGGPGAAASAVGAAVLNSNGGVGAITVTTGGSGYSPATVRVQLVGGGGFGALATAQVGASGGPVTGFTTTTAGQGYTSPPTVIITDTNNPVIQATVNLMPFSIQGTTVETFTGRVWISNGAAPTTPPPKSLTFFSAPGSPSDFTLGDGAGSFLSTDSFLRVGYHGLRQSNGFLYLVGDSSVNYISGVSTSGSPPSTTFSNQNVDPQIGSPWPNTLQVFSRSIVFANTFGVFSLYGGAVQKVSNQLDGIYTSVVPSGNPPLFNGNLQPSSAIASIFGIPVYLMLIPIIDQITGQKVNKLMIWDGKRWFTAQPSVTLTQIATQEINSVLTAYGTDGRSIYPLFQTPSRQIAKTVQSKWFTKPTYVMQKKAQYIAGLIKSLGSQNAVLTVTVDSESANQAITFTDTNVITWVNSSQSIVTWTTASGAPVSWTNPSTGVFVLPIDVSGSMIGMTATTNTADMVLNSLSVAAQQFSLLI